MLGSVERGPGPDSQTQGKWAPLLRWPCWCWEIGLALIACVWNKWEMWFPQAWDSREGTTDHYTLTSPAQWRWQGHGGPKGYKWWSMCEVGARVYLCVFLYKGHSRAKCWADSGTDINEESKKRASHPPALTSLSLFHITHLSIPLPSLACSPHAPARDSGREAGHNEPTGFCSSSAEDVG